MTKRIEQRDVPIGSRAVVRPRFASLIVSAIAHAIALVWLAGHLVAATSGPVHAPTAVAAPHEAPHEAPAMVVEIVALDPPPRIPERPHPVASSAAVAGARAAAPAVAHPPAREGGASSTDTHGARPAMTMRYPKLGRGPSEAFVDNLLDHTPPSPPPALNTAAHASDDKLAELDLRLASPRYREIATSEEIANAQVDLDSLRRERDDLTMVPIGGGRYRNREQSFTIDIAPDGTVAITDKPAFVREGLGVRFDIADMIMRARGEDPYARAKLHFLDSTRDERAGIGRANRAALLGRSAQLMRANIDRLWAMTRDPRARREGLFELWDDCAETGDAELRAGADAARLMVIGEIRARLQGPDAYTEDELGRLNARRTSIAPFAPYSELAMRAPVDDPD